MSRQRLARQVLVAAPTGRRSTGCPMTTVAWPHLWHCLVPFWYGASRTTWYCCWLTVRYFKSSLGSCPRAPYQLKSWYENEWMNELINYPNVIMGVWVKYFLLLYSAKHVTLSRPNLILFVAFTLLAYQTKIGRIPETSHFWWTFSPRLTTRLKLAGTVTTPKMWKVNCLNCLCKTSGPYFSSRQIRLSAIKFWKVTSVFKIKSGCCLSNRYIVRLPFGRIWLFIKNV